MTGQIPGRHAARRWWNGAKPHFRERAGLPLLRTQLLPYGAERREVVEDAEYFLADNGAFDGEDGAGFRADFLEEILRLAQAHAWRRPRASARRQRLRVTVGGLSSGN